MSGAPEIYQLKVRLLGISPMIWRRVLVPSSITLRALHGVLQVAMGWEGIHLFLFDVYAARYGSLELHVADPDVPLQQFGFRKNERFSYIYDMGDRRLNASRMVQCCLGGGAAQFRVDRHAGL